MNASNDEVHFEDNDNEESAEKVEQESEIENLDITKKVELEKVVANHDTAEEVDNGDKIRIETGVHKPLEEVEVENSIQEKDNLVDNTQDEIIAKDTIDKPVECGLCYVDCKTEKELEKHWYKQHKDWLPDTEEWEYLCEVCNRTFKTTRLLNQHTRRKHK